MGRIVQLVLCLCIALAAGGCATRQGAGTDVQALQTRQCPDGSVLPAGQPCPPEPLEPLEPPLPERLCPGDLVVPADRECPPLPQVMPGFPEPRDDAQEAEPGRPDPAPPGRAGATPPALGARGTGTPPSVRSCAIGPDGDCVQARSMVGRFGSADFYIAAPATVDYDKQFAVAVVVDAKRDPATAAMLSRRYPDSVVHRAVGPWDLSMSAQLESNPHFKVVDPPGSPVQPVDNSGPATWIWTLKAVQESDAPTPLVAQLRVHMTGASGQQAMPVGPALEAPVKVDMPFLTKADLWLNPVKSIYSQLALVLGGLWGGITWLRKRLKPTAAPGAAPAGGGAAPA